MAEFIKHTSCESCGSSDAKAVYSDGSSYCFSCEKTTVSEEFKQANSKVNRKVNKEKERMEETEVVKQSKPNITEEKNAEIKSATGIKGNGYRGLKDEYTKLFGVRYSYDEETGEVTEQYYPITAQGTLSGYKVREIPKSFRSIARTGADCDVLGAFKFNRGGKYVVIVEGELCMLSAYQMLAEYNKQRNSEYEIAVVSPTTGANSHKQIANNYKFFDSFDNIILAMDADEAGKKAEEKIIKALPKGKDKVMQLRYKESNEYQ